MAPNKVRLAVDSYDQPNGDKPEDGFTARTRGELFQPRNQAEYDRLTEIGAAEDPQELQRRAQAEAEQRLEQLKAEQERLEAEVKATKQVAAPEKLSGKDLDAELSSRGLSTDGSKQDKQERLAQAVAAENPPQ